MPLRLQPAQTVRRTLRLIALSLTLGLAALSSLHAAETGFLQRVYRDSDGEHRYAVYVPPEYEPAGSRRWPVVLFLHGAGERGSDGVRPTTVGLGPMIRRRKKSFPFLVVFPQCETLRGRLLTSWNAGTEDADRALKILAEVESQFRVDADRRVLTGWSMGGYGAWSLAAADPQQWSAVAPIAGGGSPTEAAKLKDVPIWAFHGEHDRAVLPAATKRMVTAVRNAGGEARQTIVGEIGHGVWKTAYNHDPLIEWMLNPKHDSAGPAELTAADEEKTITPDDHLVPFVPAVQVSQAVTLRLGGKFLDSLSKTIPQSVPRRLLSGRIADVNQQTVVEGRTFNLQFMQISYSASVAKVKIAAAGRNHLRVAFGLRNVRLKIGKTYVTGRNRWAVAGPIDILIGHRRPVWLTMDLQPAVSDRTLKLRLQSRSFQITKDNWRVARPTVKEVHGWGMTKEGVAKSLVEGLTKRKDRLEREVAALVPSLVDELERQLELPNASGLISGLWPLPVLRPRVRIWPESVDVAEGGVTVSFGLSVAAIDPSRAPEKPRQAEASAALPPSLKSGEELHVGVAPAVLTHLTQVLIDADMARIHVLDLPEQRFGAFVERRRMVKAIPMLKTLAPDGPLNAELALRRPMTIAAAKDAAKSDSKHGSQKASPGTPSLQVDAAAAKSPLLQFRDVRLAVFARSGAQKPEAKPLAEFSIDLFQPLTIRMTRRGFTGRALSVEWTAPPEIQVEGHLAKGVRPTKTELNLEIVRELFLAAWRSWSQSFAEAQAGVPDINVADVLLRLEAISWSADQLVVTFGTPGVKLSNETDRSLRYEVKGPNSRWGGPYTLPAGEAHEFAVPYDILYRRWTGNGYREFRLPAGSHSVYQSVRAGQPPRLYKGE